MDQRRKSLQEEKSRSGNRSPSFSSTLLDAIYRSFDEGDHTKKLQAKTKEEFVHCRSETMKKKQSISSTTTATTHKNTSINFRGVSNNIVKEEQIKEISSQRHACLIDKWMEKKVSTEKLVNVRRKSMPDFDRKLLNNDRSSSSMFFHSTSSSSDSSSGGGFSSSEAESVYGSRSTRSSSVPVQRPKPVKTSAERYIKSNEIHQNEQRNQPKTKTKTKNNNESGFIQTKTKNNNESGFIKTKTKNNNESGFIKTKTRALKIYGDLKKVKQPISPGGKLASFINSLFTPKKSKISISVGGGRGQDDLIRSDLRTKSKSEQASPCSTASSFSRSCLSKAPSSNGKFSNGIKRSVRFYPVSVIVDEDSQPCGHKSLDQPSIMSLNEELKFHLKDTNQRVVVEEVDRDLIESYRKISDFNVRVIDVDNDRDRDHEDDEEDDEDDDGASYASSDLFELDNLGVIGIDRYTEELPVYETTHFETNRAIANGYIL